MTKKKPVCKAEKLTWTRNRGKKPVADGVYIIGRRRDKELTVPLRAGDARWEITGAYNDIMAWSRVRKPRADKGTKLGRTLADLAASKHPRLEVTGDGKVHLDLGAGNVSEPQAGRDCRTCRHARASGLDEPCNTCVERVRTDGTRYSLWESPAATESVRHFDRSDEMPDPLASKDGYTGMKAVGFELVAAHQLADQLDPTTPARPVWDEHRDGDSDGLGCARAAVWSLVAIFAVALVFVGIRALMGG